MTTDPPVTRTSVTDPQTTAYVTMDPTDPPVTRTSVTDPQTTGYVTTDPADPAVPGATAVTESSATLPLGGTRSFEALFRTEFPTLFRLAHLLGAADPEDVVQEAFARLHARWPSLSDRGAAGGYLRATVLNLVRSAARRRAVARRHAPTLADGDQTPSAESAALASVSDAAMLAALRDLSPRHREALVLRFWLDASERQIAQAMGTSIGTAKSHLSRGLKALRAALADRGELR